MGWDGTYKEQFVYIVKGKWKVYLFQDLFFYNMLHITKKPVEPDIINLFIGPGMLKEEKEKYTYFKS